MIGTTLGDIRSYIESLASEDGLYYLVCARYGDRPVPAADLRFESRATARAAASATEQYREALRRYDPQLPYYDVIVCEVDYESVPPEYDTGTEKTDDPASVPQTDDNSDDWRASEGHFQASTSSHSDRIEFCHRVAAAVFEALSDAGHDGVESAVMDVYFDLAETVTDLDDLCLCLLESMATEIDQRLTPDEQAAIISTAAARLPTPPTADHPIAATLAQLEQWGLLGNYMWSPVSNEPGDDAPSVVVQMSDYALSPRNDRLPVLPVIVELVRYQSNWTPSSVDVVAVDTGWQIRIELARDSEPSGLVSAPIQPEV